MIVYAGLSVPATIAGFDGEPSVVKAAAATRSIETRSMAQGPGKTKAGPNIGLPKKARLRPAAAAVVGAAPATTSVATAAVAPAVPGTSKALGATITLLPAAVPPESGKGMAQGASKGKSPAKAILGPEVFFVIT